VECSKKKALGEVFITKNSRFFPLLLRTYSKD